MTDYENTALPDLTADHIITRDSSGALSRTFQLGGNFGFFWEEHNIGTASLDPNINPYQIGIYLSTDSTISTDDISLDIINVPAPGISSSVLTSGAGTAWRTSVSLRADVAPGDYYLGVIEDFGNSVAELNETNNSPSAIPITVTGSAGVISIDNVSITEGNSGATSFTFTVTRSGSTSGTNTVQWQVAFPNLNPNDATGSGFVGGSFPSGLVTFNPGDTTRTITVNVQGDTAVKPNEPFAVVLSSPSGGATIGTGTALGTIINDDSNPPEANFKIVGDFNGDSSGDILWQHTSGQHLIWNISNDQISGGMNLPTTTSDWHTIAFGDFNHDGTSDILWQNEGGQNLIWNIRDDQIIGGGNLPSTTGDWHINGVRDFNGDGTSDILWHNDNGQNLIWNISNDQIGGGLILPTTTSDWHIADLGDFNHDGTSDILWHNDGGQNLIWDIANSQIVGGANLPTTTGDWHAVGTGNFAGNGMADILWHNDNGQNLIWDIANNQIVGGANLPTTTGDWHVAGLGDLNHDGFTDILWRNDGGQNLVWNMRNDQLIGGANLPAATGDWHILS